MTTVVNQVKFSYADRDSAAGNWSGLVEVEQEHDGAVDGSTPAVGYTWSDGASGNVAKHQRLVTLTYPNGREIDYPHGSAGGLDDRLNRVEAIEDGATTLASYKYLGSGTVVRLDYEQPQVRLDLWGGTSGTYAGLDRFGRRVDHRWVDYGSSTDADRFRYGYDRASNRIWRENVQATMSYTATMACTA